MRRPKPPPGPDLEGLKALIDDKDRQSPPHFAGRGDEIKAVQAAAARVRAGRGAGLTEVFTAAPGGGKTALLGELARRWRESGEADVVRFESPRSFADPRQAMGEVLRQLNPKAGRRAGIRTDTLSGGGGLRLPFIHGAGRKARAVRRDTRPERFKEALALAKRKDPQKPVVVLVDEAQGFPKGDGPAGLLLEAHQGGPEGSLPVLLVFAGLGDTRERLAECGLSKDATDKSDKVLGPLSAEEMDEICRAFFTRFRIRGGKALKAEWAAAIADGTDGWPRHLTNALRGAAEAIIEGKGDLAASSLPDARESAEAYRQEYYSRTLAPFRGMPEMLARVLAALPERPPGEGEGGEWSNEHAIKQAIEGAYEGAPRLAGEMPKDKVLPLLRHKGLIQDFGQDRCACPIPSFWGYAEEFCAQRGFPAAGRAEEAAPPEEEAAAPAPGG